MRKTTGQSRWHGSEFESTVKAFESCCLQNAGKGSQAINKTRKWKSKHYTHTTLKTTLTVQISIEIKKQSTRCFIGTEIQDREVQLNKYIESPVHMLKHVQYNAINLVSKGNIFLVFLWRIQVFEAYKAKPIHCIFTPRSTNKWNYDIFTTKEFSEWHYIN